MNKIGKLTRTYEGKFRLSYKFRDDRRYKIVERQPQHKIFDSEQEALKFIKGNSIELETIFNPPGC